MTLFTDFTLRAPVLRIKNRDENIRFYTEQLGLRKLSEENAVIYFGDQDSKQVRFVIEESPEIVTRSVVDGVKKLGKIVFHVGEPTEILRYLAHYRDHARQVFKGEKGYAFEVQSPEKDVFLVHAEDDIYSLQPVDLSQIPSVEGVFDGFSSIIVDSIALNAANLEESQSFYRSVLGLENTIFNLEVIEKEGQDLKTNPDDVWDIELIEIRVPSSFEMKQLKKHFEAEKLPFYMDAAQKVVTVTDPSGIEIWFMKE